MKIFSRLALITIGISLFMTACGGGSGGSTEGPAVGSTTVTPASFAFHSIYAGVSSTSNVSDIVQVNGLSATALVQVDANGSGSEFRICADAACNVVKKDWRSTATDLFNNDYLQVRLNSATTTDTTATVVVRVGSGSASFTVNTKSFCELAFTQTDHFIAAASINLQSGWSRTAGGLDEQIETVGGTAFNGINVWKLSNKVISTGYGDQPLSPILSESAGESSVRSPGGGDAMETVFWMKPVASQADGSAITLSMSPSNSDRQTYFRIENNLDANGGNQIKVIDYFDVARTNAYRTFVPSTGISRTAWTKVRLVMETPDGSTNDVFQIFVNDQLVGTYSTWEDYHTWSLGGNSVTEAVNRLLFRVSVAPSSIDASFADVNAQGFYLDNLCYRVYKRATPTSTLQHYRTAFEP